MSRAQAERRKLVSKPRATIEPTAAPFRVRCACGKFTRTLHGAASAWEVADRHSRSCSQGDYPDVDPL